MALILAGGDGGNSTITGSTSNVTITNAQSLQLPSGNSAQRPSSPANGAIRYNTTTSSVEGYTAGAWGSIGGAGGGITWANVQTGNFTASVGNAYPVNTTSSAIWVTLPSSPGAGNTVQIVDYAQTFSVNNCTLNPNGGKISANTSNITITTNGTAVTLVYIDSTRGWIPVDGFSTPPVGQYSISYVIVAGGGSGGSMGGSNNSVLGAGGGAGGMVTGSGLTVTPGTSYTVTVGGGGAGSTTTGTSGSNSSITGATAAIGGGYGSGWSGSAYYPAVSGGSGGGGAYSYNSPGSGTAGQGNPGGTGTSAPAYTPGGGGGAGAPGGNYGGNIAGTGGAGVQSSISGTPTYYAGGGGGGGGGPVTAAPGGAGGGGAGGSGTSGTAGTANSGSGGGGAGGNYNGPYPNNAGGGGGSGIVIISYAGSQRGTGGSVTSSGGNTIHTFTTSGTFVA